MQRQAEKKVPKEKDMIRSNKMSFGDAIGSTTNVITAQICKLAAFDSDSDEYKELSYRVLCGQLYQQCCIDKAKGIIAKPMPNYWKSAKAVKNDLEKATLYRKIAVERKPYFFIYNYEKLYTRYNRYMQAVHESYACEYGGDFDADYVNNRHDKEKEIFFDYFEKLMPVDDTPCTMNRICHRIESETKDIRLAKTDDTFDIKLLKSPSPSYSMYDYYQAREAISEAYGKYCTGMKELNYKLTNEYVHGADRGTIIDEFKRNFLMNLKTICDNNELVCDILIDIAYKNKKSMGFVWETCGKQIVWNLLERHDGVLAYPVIANDNAEFEYHGIGFKMEIAKAEVVESDESIF